MMNNSNILPIITVVICIFMQIAVVLPHHHHQGKAAACVNPLHCYVSGEGEQEATNKCADGIEHQHDMEGDFCTYDHIDITISFRDKSDQPELIPIYYWLAIEQIVGEQDTAQYRNRISNREIRQNEGAVPLYVSYVGKVAPTRGPTFTV